MTWYGPIFGELTVLLTSQEVTGQKIPQNSYFPLNNRIVITADIDADIKKVWDYYTIPEHITKWNFADPSWQCPSASNDILDNFKKYTETN
ncbi:MAG TPA: hypothetical protein VGI38_04650 [Puia sp.]